MKGADCEEGWGFKDMSSLLVSLFTYHNVQFENRTFSEVVYFVLDFCDVQHYLTY